MLKVGKYYNRNEMGQKTALIKGRNFWTGDATYKNKLAYFLKAHERIVRKIFGDDIIDKNTPKFKRWIYNKNPNDNTLLEITEPAYTIPIENQLSGESFEGVNGTLSEIKFSRKVLNAYYWHQDPMASAVYFHEYFHALDNYNGMAGFIKNDLVGKYGLQGYNMAINILEYYTYERTYNMFGMLIGKSQYYDYLYFIKQVFGY